MGNWEGTNGNNLSTVSHFIFFVFYIEKIILVLREVSLCIII